MHRTLTLVPRWAGQPGSDFHPWLTTCPREQPSGFDTVRALDMPEPKGVARARAVALRNLLYMFYWFNYSGR